MTLELVIILLLILANGVFAAAEIAVLSARRSRLEARALEGDQGAKAALTLLDEPNRFLSAVQIGITLVGTLAGAFGGVTLAGRLAALLLGLPLPGIAAYAPSLSFGLIVLAITFLTLVLGELVPKRLALAHAEDIARAMAPLVRRLAGLARPVVWLLAGSTSLVMHLLGQRDEGPAPASEEEIKYLMAEGARAGVFAGTEQELVERVFRFADLRVGELMKPRSEVVALALDATPEEVRATLRTTTFSRFPVYRDNLDNIVGVVHSKDILLQADGLDLTRVVRQALFVPESQLISATMRAFQVTHNQMAIVVNEYGGTEGLITLEDVLEQLVGEIADEYDQVEQAVVRREDGSLLVDGLLPVDQLKELLLVDELPAEDSYQFNTLAGFVIAQLGRLPRVGDHVLAGGRRFEVVDMVGRRVDRVLISAPSGEEADPPGAAAGR